MPSFVFHATISTKCKKEATIVKFPEIVCREARLKSGDHITLNANGDQITITKDFQCRICQKYTNQLFSKPVLASDNNQYYSLSHCGACRDIPDYSKKVDYVLKR